MDETFLARLSKSAYERSLVKGDLLVREGDPAEEFLLIYSGKVVLEILHAEHPRTTIGTLGPGEVLGWSWLLAPHQWRLDARALEPTRVLGLAAANLRRVLADHPADGYQFLMRLLPVVAHRLESTRRQLVPIRRV
ncbi:MAG: cyclic nucleotide-binding domain-containing protein [Thermoplasmata archaeon]|nr:cyclic nucleotide-binding domain-containing protein [Thermoplasmata archaeon]